MDIFLAGTPVTLAVALQDRSGNALDAESVEYRVIKQDGAEVAGRVQLEDFIPSNAEATVLVPAGLNEVAPVPADFGEADLDRYSTREVRTVELFLTLSGSGNVVTLSRSYALEPVDSLMVGLNSFQTLAQAELTALDIPALSGWALASEQEKIAALVEARVRICRLNFSLLNSNVNWGQDSLNYVPEGVYDTAYAGGNRMFLFGGNLALLTPRQFSGLPVRLRAALNKAQVAEADTILAGNDVDSKRQDGVTLETIGEVKQMYRTSKPLDLPVAKRTLRYLSLFIAFNQRIGRG